MAPALQFEALSNFTILVMQLPFYQSTCGTICAQTRKRGDSSQSVVSSNTWRHKHLSRSKGITMNRQIQSISLVVIFLLDAVHPGVTLAQSPAESVSVKSTLKLLDSWLDYQVAKQGLPSVSMGLVFDQNQIWTRSVGYADIEKLRVATPDTVYSVCSITKLFTAISVMQLRDDNALDLNSDIEKLLPWLNIQRTKPSSAPITLAGILTHSSGLPNDLASDYWTAQTFPNDDEFRNGLSDVKTLYPAGKHEKYSNVGYVIAGYAIEEASGSSYTEYVQSNILDPLDMRDTYMELTVSTASSNWATAYGGGGRHNKRQKIPTFQMKGLAASAGMASTVNDMSKFISWQFRLLNSNQNEILSKSTLQEMHRVSWYNPGKEAHRGYGFSVMDLDGRLLVGKDGGCPGYLSLVILDPESKLGVVVMTNGMGTDVWNFARGAFEMVGPAMDEAARPQSAEVLVSDIDLKKFEGVYRATPSNIEVAVVAQQDHLVGISLTSMSPAASLFRLKHVGEGRFAQIELDGKTAGYIEFEYSDDGTVSRWLELGAAMIKTH